MNSIVFLAFAAGFLTILAPCILPILPFLLGTSGGGSRWRPAAIIIGFVGTFSVVGAALATAGTFLGIESGTLRFVAVALLLVFGVALLFDRAYERLTAGIGAALARLGARVQRRGVGGTGVLSGVLVGFSLGLIWTPCAGPILGAILTIGARTKDLITTMLLMLAYAVGAGLPMLAIAYGGQRLQRRLLRIGKAQPVLNKIFGLLIVGMAVAILTGYDIVLQTWLIRFYPESFISKL